MSSLQPLFPGQPVPDLRLPGIGGRAWRLADQKPTTFTTGRRGRCCPLCSLYLADLTGKVEEFAERDVNILVASGDEQARAADAKSAWKFDQLTVGCLSLGQAREWGLCISTGRDKSSLGIDHTMAAAALFGVLPRPHAMVS